MHLSITGACYLNTCHATSAQYAYRSEPLQTSTVAVLCDAVQMGAPFLHPDICMPHKGSAHPCAALSTTCHMQRK